MSVQQSSRPIGAGATVVQTPGEVARLTILTNSILVRTKAAIEKSREHNKVPKDALRWVNGYGAVEVDVPDEGHVHVSITGRNGGGSDAFTLTFTPAGWGMVEKLTSDQHPPVGELYSQGRALANEPSRILQEQRLAERAEANTPGM